MAADPNCQAAHQAAEKAANAAAKALGVKNSPLVKELSSMNIPDAGEPQEEREAFIDKMADLEKAAKSLGDAAKT